MILGIVSFSFLGLMGVKYGWYGVMAVIIGMVVKAAFSVDWVYEYLGYILLSVVLLVVVKAMFELMAGVQILKQNGSTQAVKDAMVTVQSKPTTWFVSLYKKYLALRGK